MHRMLQFQGVMLLLAVTIQVTASSQSEDNPMNDDLRILRELNALFIRNYITQDTASHNKIIHTDFVCIQNSGEIMDRDAYLKEWAHSYGSAGFISFDYTEEVIRIFGTVALVRSKTIWAKVVDGKRTTGASVYTDTYVKENGRWLCVQAQITPIK